MITRLVYGWMALWVADLATAQLPISPCPGIFHYEYYASQWTGLVTINTPYQTNVIYLRVKMSIAARLSTTYGGKLDLVDNQAASLQQALQGGVIHYRVYFPLTSPLPVLTDLTLNGNLLCQGPPEQASYVTTISLDHKLFTTESFQPSITYNQPHNQYYGPGADTYGQQGSGYQIAAQVTAKPEPAYQPIAYPDIINYSGDNINQPIGYPVIPTSTTSGTTLRRPTKKVWKCGVLGQVRLVPLIVGGETTAPGDWPWLAVILIDDVKSLKFICGGTIVSNKHIVTAAHCVHTEKGKLVTIGDVFVRVGAYNLHEWTDESRPQGVAHISLTSDFSQENNLKDDIAILVLKKFLTFSQNVTPVCLWREDSDLSRVVGVKSTVVGWGRDENGLSATPEPRRAFLSVVSSETCRSSRVEFEAYVTDKVFCAGDRNGSGPCKGDSGGGLYIYRNNRWRLRGVVSFSLQDPTSSNICNVYEYIIFTDAAKYVPWIDKIIKTNQ